MLKIKAMGQNINQTEKLAHNAFDLAQKAELIGSVAFQEIFPQKILAEISDEAKLSDESLSLEC
jgi:hypothetical protein